MSHTAHERETIHETDVHTVPPVSSTVVTFVVLLLLAAGQLAVGFSDLGSLKVVANLGVTGIQVAILSYFFMDLKQSDTLTWLCVGASIFWSGLLFLFTLTDYITRHYAAY